MSLGPNFDLSAAYTYYPTYVQVLKDYDRQPVQPVVMIESDYEFEPQHPAVLRRQEYWSLLSGAAGRFTATATPGRSKPAGRRSSTRPGRSKWLTCKPSSARAPGTTCPRSETYGSDRRLRHVRRQDHRGNRYVMASDYVTAGRTPDGTLVMAYLPSLRTVKVDIAQLAGPGDAAGTTRAEARTRRWRDHRCRIRASNLHPARKQWRWGRGMGAGIGDDAAQGR